MKIILSRKGFDIKNGGIPSILLPSKELISFPIPSDNDSIKFEDLNHPIYGNYHKIINDLKPNLLQKSQTCHLDPDIYKNIIKRDAGWNPLFGPYFRAYTHLREHDITINDIFLFFGSFREVEIVNNSFKFKKGSPVRHIIFGYFQIGKIIEEEKDIELWMRYHSHVPPNRQINQNNVVFIASEKLSFDEKLPGASPLQCLSEDTILTQKTGDSYLSKSKWYFTKNTFGKKINISYHKPKSWNANYFQSANIGQEFVLEETSKVTNWAENIIKHNLIQ